MANGQSPSEADPGRSVPPDTPSGIPATGDAATRSASSGGRRWWMYIGVAAVVAISVVAASYAVMETMHKSTPSSGGSVLIPAGTLYSLPPGQYNAVVFALKSPATVVGTLTNVGGMQLYVMSPSEYLELVLTYNVSGYAWTSGAVPSDTYYQLEITIPPGTWDLVFSNSVPGNTTAIGFYSNLVENP